MGTGRRPRRATGSLAAVAAPWTSGVAVGSAAAAGLACARGACGRSRRTWATGPDAVRPPTTATPPGTATAAASESALGQTAGAAGARLARRPGEDRRGRAAAPQAAENVQAVAHGGGRGVVERPRKPAGADHPSAGRVVGKDVACRRAGRVLAAGEQHLAAQGGHGGVAQAPRQLRRQVGGPAAGVAVDRCVGGGAVPAADHVDGAADRHRAVVGERLGQAADAARRAGGRRARSRRCLRPGRRRTARPCPRSAPPPRRGPAAGGSPASAPARRRPGSALTAADEVSAGVRPPAA